MKLEEIKKQTSDAVLEALDKGVAIWTRPWVYHAENHGFQGKPYKGSNVILTALYNMKYNYQSTAWLTWNKFINLQKSHPEIKMKKGSKGVNIVYWMVIERKDKDGNPLLDKNGDPITLIFPKYYRVFNADCFENLVADEYEKRFVLDTTSRMSLEEKEKRLLELYKGAPVVIHRGQAKAYYSVDGDKVCLPLWKDFKSEALAYSTLCHELVHSTGSKERNNRTFGEYFGDQKYSYEELVAEIGAAMLSAEAGYIEETVENSAAYLQGWSKALKDHSAWFWDAFNDATKAVERILGKEKKDENLSGNEEEKEENIA